MEKKTEQNKTTEQTMSEQTRSEQTTSEHPTSTVAEPTVEEIATLALKMALANLYADCTGCALFPRCAVECAYKHESPKRDLEKCPRRFVKYAKEIFADLKSQNETTRNLSKEIIAEGERNLFADGGSNNAED